MQSMSAKICYFCHLYAIIVKFGPILMYLSLLEKSGGVRNFQGAGHICLDLIFGKISHRLTRDFRTTDKKSQNLFESDAQNCFNQKSVGVQPCIPL